MNDIRLGIYAPYDRTLESAAAARLAGFAAANGWPVEWLTPLSRHRRLSHPSFDKTVRIGNPANLARWAQRATITAWFEADRHLFRRARQAASPFCRHVLAVPWPHLHEADLGWISWFDHLVCNCGSSFEMLVTSLPQESGSLSLVPWTAGIKPRLRPQPATGGIRVLYHLDHHTLRVDGHRALASLEQLLEVTVPESTFTLVSGISSLDGRCRSRLRKMQEFFGPRLAHVHSPGYDQLLDQVQQHDLLVGPWLRFGIGEALLLVQARAMGVPSAVWDVESSREMIEDHQDGIVVPGGASIVSGQLGESAIWCSDELLRWVRDVVNDTQRVVLQRMQETGHQRAVSENNQVFEDFWRDMLNPSSSLRHHPIEHGAA